MADANIEYDANIVFIEKYMDAADEKNRELIKAKLTLWVNSCHAMNEGARNFSQLYFCDDDEYPENVIAEMKKNRAELQRAELVCRSDVGRQIAFYATMAEYRQMNLKRPGQIIDWAINEGRSPIASQAARWDWILEIPGVIYCNPGPNKDIQLEPISQSSDAGCSLLDGLSGCSLLDTEPGCSLLDGDNARKENKKGDGRKKNKKDNARKKKTRG